MNESTDLIKFHSDLILSKKLIKLKNDTQAKLLFTFENVIANNQPSDLNGEKISISLIN